MSSFFSLRSSSSSIVVRCLFAVIFLTLGYFAYWTVRHVFNPVRINAYSFEEVMLYEWLIVLKPLVFIIPGVFLALLQMTRTVHWKTLLVFTVLGTLLLSAIPTIVAINKWRYVLSFIEGATLSNVHYWRNTGSFPDGSAHLEVDFILSENNYQSSAEMIHSRMRSAAVGDITYDELFLTKKNGQIIGSFSYIKRTPQGEKLSDKWYDFSKYEGTIEGSVDFDPKYLGFD